ncbi:MAG: hypothetical protein IPJ10_16030 [Flavobacteriales bacterium]|nr:hypothetical protein [Flavobacteriales bacterium]
MKKFQYDIWGDTVNTASRMDPPRARAGRGPAAPRLVVLEDGEEEGGAWALPPPPPRGGGAPPPPPPSPIPRMLMDRHSSSPARKARGKG